MFRRLLSGFDQHENFYTKSEADGVPEIKPELDKDVPVGRVPEFNEYVGAEPESSVAVN